MTKATFYKGATGFQPADNDAAELWMKYKLHDNVLLEILSDKPRNIKQHRLFMALMQLLVEGGLFDSVDDARYCLTIACGEFDVVHDHRKDRTYTKARSIAFHAMSQERFDRLFKRAVEVICSRYLENITSDALIEKALMMIDGPEKIGRRIIGQKQ
jgi:hypothetical protein